MRAPLALALAALSACATTPAAPRLAPAELRVLFVGNSLTYTNDLPGRVARLASLAGVSFSHASVARPDYSLEDHVAAGLLEVIATTRPDVVVMQQGPSSLPASRAELVAWSRRVAAAVRAAGGEPVLLMVWPPASRRFAFDDVRGAYAAAAAAVGGEMVPAGEAWRAAWELDPTLELYGPDGFHPAELGTLAAALATWTVLASPPPRAVDCPPAAAVAAEPAALATLCAAVAAALAGAAAP